MSTKKVVTVTLNPALDLTGHLNSLNVGTVSLVNQGNLHAAGKGVNVAQVLCDLGAEVTVTGFIGTDNQEMFCQLFQKLGVNDRFIRVNGATRINVKLVEQSGETSDINFPGVQVTASDVQQFETELFALALDHDYFVIAGSLPNGVSASQCAVWIQRLHAMGKKVFFDSSRAALKAGLDANPWLVKPNDEELSELVGRELKTAEQCQEAAQELADKGIENIVVSMGSEGVMWLNNSKWFRSQPPRMEVVSTVGAGDTLVAGLCWGHMQQMDKPSLLTFATALSALAVSQVGVGVKSRQELERLQQQVKFQQLN
ncbi:1-phosphofructokinase [Vibrio sp. TH_r3]|uniref:1-phosphofructokinase n=1 Tax=Vibrio sp. TH_r3 TaxID=3082084 RepID=UPI0029558C4F|nr:1-phosphofructokinase [Vibrio sp. TH_r3]MDV7104671.1 1-phosphofructokinase [Vibrio sp. TH_r3]